jgi:hypothetical protein
MPAFRPCIGTRAQIDARPVRDGQFLVATDTGEAFIDFGGVRIRISGSSGGGGGQQPGDGDGDDEDSLLTSWTVVNAALLMSESVPGGGPGAGVLNAPAVVLEQADEALLTAYAVQAEASSTRPPCSSPPSTTTSPQAIP